MKEVGGDSPINPLKNRSVKALPKDGVGGFGGGIGSKFVSLRGRNNMVIQIVNPNEDLEQGCPRVIHSVRRIQGDRDKRLDIGDSQSRMKLGGFGHGEAAEEEEEDEQGRKVGLGSREG